MLTSISALHDFLSLALYSICDSSHDLYFDNILYAYLLYDFTKLFLLDLILYFLVLHSLMRRDFILRFNDDDLVLLWRGFEFSRVMASGLRNWYLVIDSRWCIGDTRLDLSV